MPPFGLYQRMGKVFSVARRSTGCFVTNLRLSVTLDVFDRLERLRRQRGGELVQLRVSVHVTSEPRPIWQNEASKLFGLSSRSRTRSSGIWQRCTTTSLPRVVQRNEAGSLCERNQETSFSRIAFLWRAGIALLTLLATPSMLEALSSDLRVPGFLECGSRMEPRNAGGIDSSEAKVVLDYRTTSTAQVHQMSHTGLCSGTRVPLRTLCVGTIRCVDGFSVLAHLPYAATVHDAAIGDRPTEDSNPPSVVRVKTLKPVDLNRSIYYKNKLELSLDGGWLPINIPFVFDVFLGDGYNTTPLKYTLVPLIVSLRWQMSNVAGAWILRGNWELTTSAAAVVIPRGPETRYIAWIMGLRRNFVPRHGRIAPYFDGRLGLGNIDAKGPAGVFYAQGQDFTFTVNMGSGVRYNFGPRLSISAGLNWMHISNLYLSEPKFANYGINVYGPMFGINMLIGRLGRHASE